jgi:sialate O-acetylesterase
VCSCIIGSGRVIIMMRTLCFALMSGLCQAGRPPPPPPPPLTFSSTCGDWMVLQQAPAKAAVSGTLNVTSAGRATVEVSVSDHASGAAYKVQAAVSKLGPGPTNPGGAAYKWKAFLHPTKAGGDLTITATSGAHSSSISHLTFGDVWYCSGQSNMALPLGHTMSRNISADAIRAGKYKNLRIHGMSGNMNPYQNWSTVSDAVAKLTTGKKGAGIPVLFTFSSTCYYFGESLIDKLGDNAPPIGLIHTAWGGSRIEAWVDNKTLATCTNSTGQPIPASAGTAKFHEERVIPYLDSSIKGWVWYQV